MLSYAAIIDNYRVDEEPVVVRDGGRVEEEGGTGKTLGEEVGCEEGDPLEELEARARLEHEHGDRLLEDETDNDSRPPPHVSTCIHTRGESQDNGA